MKRMRLIHARKTATAPHCHCQPYHEQLRSDENFILNYICLESSFNCCADLSIAINQRFRLSSFCLARSSMTQPLSKKCVGDKFHSRHLLQGCGTSYSPLWRRLYLWTTSRRLRRPESFAKRNGCYTSVLSQLFHSKYLIIVSTTFWSVLWRTL